MAQLNPAKSIISKLGGAPAVAEITGKHPSRVYRWMQPKEAGGTGGLIPNKEAMKILDAASKRGVALDPSEFFAVPREDEREDA